MQSRLIYNICRYTLSALFLFSGFAKGVNPFGLSLQFADYFAALSLGSLVGLSWLAAIVLPAVEMVLGVLLASGLWRRVTAWTALLFMSFFTLLTLWIATTNPVSDCGCFGDLLVISNWATFYKNIAFTAAAIVVFVGRNRCGQRSNWTAAIVATALCLALPIYSYITLPIIDATPYKIGVNIADEMQKGESDQTQTTLIYRELSSGKEREFALDDTTWQDTLRWEFVDSRTTIIKQGHQPTIKSLPMIDSLGVDRSGDVLRDKGRVLLIIADNPMVQSATLTEIIGRALLSDIDRIVLLHSTIAQIEIAPIEVYTSDQSLLRTMIQNAKGGTILLNNGVIEQKTALDFAKSKLIN